MYPSMPSPPVQTMQGENPAQQFGYMQTPMQKGIGSMAPQMPMYGAYPTYMAQGGQVSAKGQGMPPMQGLSQQQMAPNSGKAQMLPPGAMQALSDYSQQQAMQQALARMYQR